MAVAAELWTSGTLFMTTGNVLCWKTECSWNGCSCGWNICIDVIIEFGN